MAATATRATVYLDEAGIEYELLTYDVDEGVGDGYGVAVAQAIGLDAAQVFKTLVAEADGSGVVAIIPVAQRVSVKLLARAVGAKKCALVAPEQAERWTGYVVGGVSPFGQKRRFPFVVDSSATQSTTIAVSAGRRGLQLLVSPQDLIDQTGAITAAITA